MSYQPEPISDYNEGIARLFISQEDAVYALYEQLFDSLNAICPYTILDAMKYLVHSFCMTDQMEEMRLMREEDVCVLHHREVDKQVEESTKEIKKSLYEILEDKLSRRSI